MNIRDFAKLIRQTPTTVRNRIYKGEIPATHGVKNNTRYWNIDDNYIKSLIGKNGSN